MSMEREWGGSAGANPGANESRSRVYLEGRILVKGAD